MLRMNVFADQTVDTAPHIARMRRIGFLIYPDIEALDICGPLGAFAYADCYLREAGRTSEPGYEVLVIAASAGLVRTQSGLQIEATHGCDQVMHGLDTLIVVGGVGAEAACADRALVDWLQAVAPLVRRLASVCTGAFC
jgi:transcriptional regulator GlxA family with amidase domain